jgi:hypothetical protein
MRLPLFAISVLILGCGTATLAAPPIGVELATERGVQITAPQEWLQLLAGMGIKNVRIRGAQSGDEPTIANVGTEKLPRYEVVGIITARNQLRLVGSTFSRTDRARIKDYFDRLANDGAESLSAPRGMFDLTEKEIEAVFADLSQPIDFETKSQPPRAVLEKLQSKFASKLAFDGKADLAFQNAKPIDDELRGLSAGTGLAIILRANDLAMRPEKHRGEPLAYYIAAAVPAAQTTAAAVPAAQSESSPTDPPVATSVQNLPAQPSDSELEHWPIGWEPQEAPVHIAPPLFKVINAEIDGYSLAETLSALGPRLKVPMYTDHAALAANNIDPSKIQIRLPQTRTSLKRILDRALAQARLAAQLRTDEAGNPFLWITR